MTCKGRGEVGIKGMIDVEEWEIWNRSGRVGSGRVFILDRREGVRDECCVCEWIEDRIAELKVRDVKSGRGCERNGSER